MLRKSSTLGFANQLGGLKVAKRLNRSPLSHGLQEGREEEPRAEPPALVLNEVVHTDTAFELLL